MSTVNGGSQAVIEGVRDMDGHWEDHGEWEDHG